MTLTEAAAALGLTAATLRQQIAKGKLAARKVGRDWTVTTGEIERYRRDSRRKGAA
jgi:excisionase family DNA binding protein